ncbi:MAG: SLBB domain-containing protein [Pyrinomonadaceae bacterium]
MNRVVERRFPRYLQLVTCLRSLVRVPPTRISPVFLVLSLILLAGHGPGQGALNTSDHAGARQDGVERIHLGDIVDVDVVGSIEFDWRGGLTPEGFLNGLERAQEPIFALCRTESEVAATVAERFASFLRDPKVIVRIVDRSNRALAYLTGAVRTPQRFQLRRPVTLRELIILSGGITDRSDGVITIFRPPNISCAGPLDSQGPGTRAPQTKPKTISIAIADLMGGVPAADSNILSGDIVTVVEASPVFVIGGVNAPKRMNLTPDLTLLRAIAAAGGVSRSYSGQKARIHRRNPAPKVLEFELRKLERANIDDPRLQPYDVIEIEQKGSGSKKLVPVEEPPEMNPQTMSRLPLRIVD